MSTIEDLHEVDESLYAALQSKRLIVCCGAGGVGKTTTSAALALAAARLGKKVLALTIDPSKRLAQTLGVDRNTPEPVKINRDRLEALNVPLTGELHAWLLDPQLISDKVVNEEAGDQAETLKNNLIYQQISGIVAGMQEYTAVEALHQFLQDRRYDLIILDTPPARHALRFIDSPERVAAFLDKRIFRLFVPSQAGLIGKMASKLIDEVLDRAFGEVTRRELKQFFELFSRLLDHLHHNQAEMSEIFKSDEVLFFMVTTARDDAIDEAQRFASEIIQRGLTLGGFFLNRCPLNESSLTQTSIESLSERLRDQRIEEDEVSSLCSLLDPLLRSELRSSDLRRETRTALKALGPLITLNELDRDPSTLEGISELANLLDKEHYPIESPSEGEV